MPQVEVKTRTRHDGRGGPEIIMQIILTPRGSGNRKLAQGLAAAARKSVLAPHIKRVRAGYSSAWVVMKPSAKLALDLLAWKASTPQDVEGQMPLFGGAVPA